MEMWQDIGMQRAAGLALMLQGMYCTVKNVVTHSQITPRHHTRSYLLRGPLLTCPRAGGEPCTPRRTPTAGCGSAWTWGRSGRGRSGSGHECEPSPRPRRWAGDRRPTARCCGRCRRHDVRRHRQRRRRRQFRRDLFLRGPQGHVNRHRRASCDARRPSAFGNMPRPISKRRVQRGGRR